MDSRSVEREVLRLDDPPVPGIDPIASMKLTLVRPFRQVSRSSGRKRRHVAGSLKFEDLLWLYPRRSFHRSRWRPHG